MTPAAKAFESRPHPNEALVDIIDMLASEVSSTAVLLSHGFWFEPEPEPEPEPRPEIEDGKGNV